MKKLLLIAAGTFALAIPVQAQEAVKEAPTLKPLSQLMPTTLKPLSVAQIEGSYAGSFLCASGEMGMSLSIQDVSGIISADGKSVSDSKRMISGVLNFFPTVGNPDAPHGAFEMSGTAEIYNYFTKVKLAPGKWLNKPENFGASGLEGMIQSKTGHFTGKPTVSGCYTLDMTKLRTQ